MTEEDNNNYDRGKKYYGVDSKGVTGESSQVEFCRIPMPNGDFFRFGSTVDTSVNVLAYVSGETGATMVLAADVGRCVGYAKPPMSRASKNLGGDEWRRTHMAGVHGTPPVYVSLYSSVDLVRWLLTNIRNLAASQFSVGAYKAFVNTVYRTTTAIAEGAYEFGFNPVTSGERPYIKEEADGGATPKKSGKDIKGIKEAKAEAAAMSAADTAKKLRKAMEWNDGTVVNSADMAEWMTEESKVKITAEMVENTLNEKDNGIPAYLLPLIDVFTEYFKDELKAPDAAEPGVQPGLADVEAAEPVAAAESPSEEEASLLHAEDASSDMYELLGKYIAIRQRATAKVEALCSAMGIKTPW